MEKAYRLVDVKAQLNLAREQMTEELLKLTEITGGSKGDADRGILNYIFSFVGAGVSGEESFNVQAFEDRTIPREMLGHYESRAREIEDRADEYRRRVVILRDEYNKLLKGK
jgi:hypothetical protein